MYVKIYESITFANLLFYLCVPVIQEKRFQFHDRVDRVKRKVRSVKSKSKELVSNIEDKGMELIQKWQEKSGEIVGSFLDMFGRDGSFVSIFLCHLQKM